MGGSGSRLVAAESVSERGGNVRSSDVARLFEASGPFLSMYLATEGDVENAAQRVAVRWKTLRADLVDAGVPEQTLEEIDPLVEGSHTAGATLAVIAAVDGVEYAGSMPHPPPREWVVRQGPLPYVIPLLTWAQSLVPHIAVLATRAHAELAARVPEEVERTEREEIELPHPPHLTRSKPGGWSQPRYQHRAEVQWERNASQVAEELTRTADRVRPRFIAAAGDVRALELLREESPKRVQETIKVVGGELGSITQVLEEAERLAAATAEADSDALLDEFEQERAQGDRAADGPEATFDALARHQVRTLLLRDRPDDERTAWFGEELGQVALDREALVVENEPTPVEGRLLDVAVRAALGTGAEVRVLGPESDGRGPSEGLGAVLRYAT
jgi:hypothetical protein